MPYHEVEETLARALTYLRLSGIRVTPEVARRALRLERRRPEPRPRADGGGGAEEHEELHAR